MSLARHCAISRTALLSIALASAPLPSFAAWADQPDSVIARVVSRVQDSVVRIVVVHRAKQTQDTKENEAQDSDPGAMTAIGSGFVIDPKGLVATNRHVVENAEAIFVGTPDGGRYRASIVGAPDRADIALLKISPNADLPAVPFGDSDALRVGDTVIAIGSPFGFDNSVSAGIVSSTNRNIQESPFDDYIQTDAAINHGNSGGPLFNLQGQVVGMNSVLYAPGKYTGSAGVGFAIPSNDLSFVYQRMEEYNGEVRAGVLPIKTQQVTELMAQAIGAPKAGGALVIEMGPRAEKMNGAIKPGDIISTFNGRNVTDPRDLAREAAKSPIGSTARLEIFREGKLMQVEVPILPLEQTSKPPEEPAPPPTTLGLHLGPSNQGPGALVSGIDRSGSVADSGLQPGDLLVQVQQQPVDSPEQAMQVIQAREASKAGYAALLVERNKQRSWIPVALPR